MGKGYVYKIFVKQWHERRWVDLSQYMSEDLEPLSRRDELALMVTVANLQLNQNDKARVFVDLAAKWGCGRRKKALYLLKGNYETFHRIRAICKRDFIGGKGFDLAGDPQKSSDPVGGQGIVLYRESAEAGELMVQVCPGSSSMPFCQPPEALVEDDVGYAEPVIDRMRWESDGVLSVLVQYNDQPQGDGVACKAHSIVKVVDFILEKSD